MHTNVHWGHMTSPDLVHWTTQSIALTPRPGELDATGCWSGCLVDEDGTPTLVYSAVAGSTADAEVVLAPATDRSALRFTPATRSVMGMPADRGLTDVRDPYVFSVDGRRFAAQGAGGRGRIGSVLLYGCDDLTIWTELGTLVDGTHPALEPWADVALWECPSLVPLGEPALGESWLLVISLLDAEEPQRDLRVISMIGEPVADGAGLRFEPTAAQHLDLGPAFLRPAGDPGR